jgi:hypothetical protein
MPFSSCFFHAGRSDNDNHSAICYRETGSKSREAGDRMIFKIIAFLAAAIPIFLFVRSIFFARTTRINEGLRESRSKPT